MESRSSAGLRALARFFPLPFLLLGLVSGCTDSQERAPQGSRPSVLLLTIDTLRADYVHAYGFEHATPSMDALAGRGLTFENAIAAATVTAPAHASIMTGRYARGHSIGTLNGETRLEGGVTLAERFREAGYRTAAFVSNVVLRRRSGLDRGFDSYDDELTQGETNRRAYFERVAAATGERAIAWLSEQADGPFFIWVHLQDPHGPYTPPQDYLGRIGEVPLRMTRPLPVLAKNKGRAGIPSYQQIEALRAPASYAGRYAEEILYADHWIGRVVESAEAASGKRDLITLLTADHGESMGELGYFFQHGQATTPDLARVPMILAAPGLATGRSEVLVSHVDVAPTLLALAGLEALPESSGLDLRVLAGPDADGVRRPIFCDTDGEAGVYLDDLYTRAGGPLASARDPQPGARMQFETHRLLPDRSLRPAPLDAATQRVLEAYMRSRVPIVLAEVMDPEHIEQLRALGYLPPREPDAAPTGE